MKMEHAQTESELMARLKREKYEKKTFEKYFHSRKPYGYFSGLNCIAYRSHT